MSDDNDLKLEFAREIHLDGKEMFKDLYELLREKFAERSVASVAFASTMLNYFCIEQMTNVVGQATAIKMTKGFTDAARLAIDEALEERRLQEETDLGINMPSDEDIIH